MEGCHHHMVRGKIYPCYLSMNWQKSWHINRLQRSTIIIIHQPVLKDLMEGEEDHQEMVMVHQEVMMREVMMDHLLDRHQMAHIEVHHLMDHRITMMRRVTMVHLDIGEEEVHQDLAHHMGEGISHRILMIENHLDPHHHHLEDIQGGDPDHDPIYHTEPNSHPPHPHLTHTMINPMIHLPPPQITSHPLHHPSVQMMTDILRDQLLFQLPADMIHHQLLHSPLHPIIIHLQHSIPGKGTIITIIIIMVHPIITHLQLDLIM